MKWEWLVSQCRHVTSHFRLPHSNLHIAKNTLRHRQFTREHHAPTLDIDSFSCSIAELISFLNWIGHHWWTNLPYTSWHYVLWPIHLIPPLRFFSLPSHGFLILLSTRIRFASWLGSSILGNRIQPYISSRQCRCRPTNYLELGTTCHEDPHA